MFDIRLRLMTDTGAKGAVLPTLAIDTTMVDSSTPTLSFTVSEKVAGRLDAPQVIALEYSTGGPYVQPRNGLFMASEDDANDADVAGTVRFAATGLVPWMLARTYLHWASTVRNGERTWYESGNKPASAGTILAGMIAESKARGWGSFIETDFSTAKDSAGADWVADDKDILAFRLLTPLTSVISTLTEQGFCDWWTEGTKLRVFRPGAGVVREDLVLGGPGFSSRPTKSSFDDVFTNLTVVPEKSRYWLYLTNPGASTRFGRLEATMTQSGVEKHDTATKLAQPTLTNGRAVKREYSFDWTPSAVGPRPFADFNIGDVVTSKTRHGKNPQRVIGIQVTKNGTDVTARVIVGDKLLSQVARQLRRTSAATIGGTIGGGGAALPVSNGPTFADPTAPTALRVESNVATWRADGTAQSTVVLAWDAVATATDGSEVDVREYEVAERIASAEAAVFATTSALTVTEDRWEPGVPRFVKVRAVAFNGEKSEWSDEISVTPAVPSSIVPKAVTGLVESSNTAAFRQDGTAVATVVVSWDAVTMSVDDEFVDVAEYEATIGQETQRVTGLTASFAIPSGAAEGVRVRALTTLGIWGDPSDVLNVTGANPAALDVAPSAPVLTPGLGGVAYRWDGEATTGAMPAGFSRIVVDSATSATGPWTALGATLSAAGGGSVSAPVEQETFVRFRAFDTLGRAMGVSEVRSAVAAGIALSDIPGLEGDLDDIRFTADGKNRVYVQKDSPGDNLFTNGSFEETAGTVEVPWDAMRPLRTITRTGVAPAQGYIPDTEIIVQPGQIIRAAVSWDSTDPADSALFGLGAFKDGEWDQPGSGVTNWGSPDNFARWIGPVYSTDRATRVKHFVVPEGVTKVQFSHYRNAGSGSYSYALSVHVVGDPDLEVTYATSQPVLGTPVNGESTLTGSRAAGVASTSGCIAVRSSQWAKSGQHSLRLIPTGTASSTTYALVGVPADAAGGGTLLVTGHQENALTGTLWATRGRPYVLSPEQAASTQTPNHAGDQEHRLVFSALATNRVVVLPHGGMVGSGDVWWDDLILLEGDVEKLPTPGDLWLQLSEDGASVVRVKVWNGTSWAPQMLYAEDIFATGSITGALVRAGTLEVNHVSPTFGEDLDLSANGSVNILVGTVNDLQGSVSEQQSAIDQQAAAIAAAQAAADTAASGASSAAIAAAAAKAAAAAAQAGVDKYGTVFAFKSDGLEISSPGSPMSLKVSNADISIRRDGVARTIWDENQMIVPKLKSAQVVVGATVITEKPGGMTWQRL